MDENEEMRNRIRMIGIFMTVPFILAVPPIIGWYMGKWLDHYFDSGYFFMFIFIILGIAAGIREFYRVLKKYGNGKNI